MLKVWLGRKTDKYDRFYELSSEWLTTSYHLPSLIRKHTWLGVVLMLISPIALVTYVTAYAIQQTYFPFSLSEEDVPYRSHEDLVAITGLQDFPTFTYKRNEKDGRDGSLIIYYEFDEKLSSAYNEKLKALCSAPDNYLWHTSGDYQYVLERGSDGKYITPSVKCGQIKLTISQNGFVVHERYDCSLRIEDFAVSDTLNKHTGVTFPAYRVVNYKGEGWRDYNVTYYLLLDEKPSKHFIKQLEHSPKWTKNENGTFSCGWGEESLHSEYVTVDPNSRLVMARYITY